MLASVADDRRSIAEAGAGLDMRNGAAETLGAMRTQRAAAETFLASASWNLEGSSPELLSAELQRSVEGYASAAGATVASSRTAGTQTEHGLDRIGLDFELQATLPELQALLARIEQTRPRIFVDRLTVQVAENGGTAKGVDGQSELGMSLHVAIYAAPRRRAAAS